MCRHSYSFSNQITCINVSHIILHGEIALGRKYAELLEGTSSRNFDEYEIKDKKK
jgi:hypothetical protein